MKRIDKKVADAYFKTRTTLIMSFLGIGVIVSFGVVLFAESLTDVSFMGIPIHYYMGAQGAIVTFIILLFLNAIISDRIDKKYGIDDSRNETIGKGKPMDH